jgi:hypothetical protein
MKISVWAIIILLIPVLCFSQEENKNAEPMKSEIMQTESYEQQDPVLDPVYTYIGIPDEISEICSSFFDTLIKETPAKAYEILLNGSPLNENHDKVKEQILQTKKAIDIYGKISGFEQAGADYVSLSYVNVKYLSLHPFNPILWTFTFYKSPVKGWIVLNLKYTDTF